jgi:hypothetical protein
VASRPVAADVGRGTPVSVSIGVSLFPSRDVRTKDALLRAADQALGNAKREGGRRVCVHQQEGQIYTPVGGEARDSEPVRADLPSFEEFSESGSDGARVPKIQLPGSSRRGDE